MPLVRIDLVQGRSSEDIQALAEAIHQALVSVLGVPERDRFQIITEHAPEHIIAQDAGLGFERSSQVVMIQIITQQGRTPATKQNLFRSLAQRLGEVGISGKDLFVGITENGSQDWSFADGRAQYLEGDLAIPH